MESWYYEDYVPGEGFRTMARTVTETDVVNFIALSGVNEPLFIDQEFLRRETEFTGRLVPGLLTFSIGEGLFVQTGVLQGRAIAFLGMDELRFIRPVYVGDTIHVRVETKEKRHTRREDRGIVVTRQVIRNQRDEEVISCTLTRMVRRRPPEK